MGVVNLDQIQDKAYYEEITNKFWKLMTYQEIHSNNHFSQQKKSNINNNAD